MFNLELLTQSILVCKRDYNFSFVILMLSFGFEALCKLVKTNIDILLFVFFNLVITVIFPPY